MEKTTLYRKIFCDITRGYSRVAFDEIHIFIRHLGTHDQVDLEDIEKDYFEKAKKRGLPQESEAIEGLKKDGTWTDEDERFIDQQSLYIENLEKSKIQLMLKSQIDQQEKIIKEESLKLSKKLIEKEELIGSTCEKFAKQRINDHYILRSYFKNEKLEEPLYIEEELDELPYSDISKLIEVHNKHFSMFSEENIQKTILQDFYYPYMPFGEDSMQFFGRPACNLTHNQMKLIIFTRVFKNIFENNENIPEKIKKDPKALLDYASTSKKGKEELEKHSDKGGASTLVGATKEDYEYMGVEESGVSLEKAAKEKGGSLSMQDMIDMTGSS